MKEKPKSSCCEKCFDSFGGGTTMLPLIRRCMNLDCSCHTTSKSEEIDPVIKYYGDQIVCISCGQKKTACKCKKPFTRLENWEEEFDELIKAFSKTEFNAMRARRTNDTLSGEIKSFISTLLQEERGKILELAKECYEDVGDGGDPYVAQRNIGVAMVIGKIQQQ